MDMNLSVLVPLAHYTMQFKLSLIIWTNNEHVVYFFDLSWERIDYIVGIEDVESSVAVRDNDRQSRLIDPGQYTIVFILFLKIHRFLSPSPVASPDHDQ